MDTLVAAIERRRKAVIAALESDEAAKKNHLDEALARLAQLQLDCERRADALRRQMRAKGGRAYESPSRVLNPNCSIYSCDEIAEGYHAALRRCHGGMRGRRRVKFVAAALSTVEKLYDDLTGDALRLEAERRGGMENGGRSDGGGSHFEGRRSVGGFERGGEGEQEGEGDEFERLFLEAKARAAALLERGGGDELLASHARVILM